MTPQRPRPAEVEPLEPSWKLPTGRHRFPREVVERHQRDRIIAGVANALSEHRYGSLTVEHVIEAAGVSRRTFYDAFANKEEAVLVAHDVIFERFLGSLVRACNSQTEWPLKVKAALAAALEFAAAEPGQAQLLTLDALASNVEIAQRVLDANEHLASLLSSGRRLGERAAALPQLTEKALIGAITAIVASRLMNREPETLPSLLPEVLELTLIPYLGAEEARRFAGVEAVQS
jgi:AcrR family transcriptional regulator